MRSNDPVIENMTNRIYGTHQFGTTLVGRGRGFSDSVCWVAGWPYIFDFMVWTIGETDVIYRGQDWDDYEWRSFPSLRETKKRTT